MTKSYAHPKFTLTLLHPKYWLTWLGLAFFYLVTLLPYPLIYRLGKALGRKSMPLFKHRVNISRRNLELCFPDMSSQEREQLLIKNFESTGLAIFETGMAWFWSDKRIKKYTKIVGLENVAKARQNRQGIIVIGIHFLTLELGARIFGLHSPGVGVYRPHNNPVMNYIQLWGRLRSNKYMLDRRNTKGMIRALKKGEILWYAPDHDYGARNSVFVPFFAVDKVATTIGTAILIRLTHPNILPFTPMRNRDGSGYTLIIRPQLENIPTTNEKAIATLMNQTIEKEILAIPEQYMWLHRRFKTRPKGEPSLY